MSDIRTLIQKQKSFYKNIISINCPILNETVYFTSEGFNHLIYESNRAPRKISEQYLKLIFLKYVPKVITNCIEILETRKTKRKIWGKYKKIICYTLVYEVIKGIKVRVIIEKIGNGKCKFKSVMPHDKKSKIYSKKISMATKKRP